MQNRVFVYIRHGVRDIAAQIFEEVRHDVTVEHKEFKVNYSLLERNTVTPVAR